MNEDSTGFPLTQRIRACDRRQQRVTLRCARHFYTTAFCQGGMRGGHLADRGISVMEGAATTIRSSVH